MMYIREQKKQLTIKSLKKVFLLVVLNIGLVLSIFNNNSYADVPRAIYGKCYTTQQSLIDGFLNDRNSSAYMININRFASSATFNTTTNVITATNNNINNGSVSSTETIYTYPCNADSQSYFNKVPMQDMFFQGSFILTFIIGVYFGFRFFKL